MWTLFWKPKLAHFLFTWTVKNRVRAQAKLWMGGLTEDHRWWWQALPQNTHSVRLTFPPFSNYTNRSLLVVSENASVYSPAPKRCCRSPRNNPTFSSPMQSTKTEVTVISQVRQPTLQLQTRIRVPYLISSVFYSYRDILYIDVVWHENDYCCKKVCGFFFFPPSSSSHTAQPSHGLCVTHVMSQPEMVVRMLLSTEGRGSERTEDLDNFSDCRAPQLSVRSAQQHGTVWTSNLDFPLIMGYDFSIYPPFTIFPFFVFCFFFCLLKYAWHLQE